MVDRNRLKKSTLKRDFLEIYTDAKGVSGSCRIFFVRSRHCEICVEICRIK